MKASNAIRAITRAELCAAIDPLGGRRLDGPTRDFLESRFGRSFQHVRIHTVVGAAALASALNARAFTVGRNIFFGAQQYAPQTAAGMRLLVHELAHIVQQNAEPSGPEVETYPVGLPFDPLDQEADVVAEQVLAGHRLSPITGDPSPVIRRAVAVKASSAKLTIFDRKKCVPAVHVMRGDTGTPAVHTHLTNNFIGGDRRATTIIEEAFAIGGNVEVTADPGDRAELKKWNFGFIQFQKINVANLLYRGNRKSHGGVAIHAHLFLPTTVGRDTALSGDPNPPFTRANTSGDKTFDFGAGMMVARTGDHPHMYALAQVQNRITGRDNFLFVLVDEREFFTVFSARDPAGRFQHLAHVDWSVRWDFEFEWLSAPPIGPRRPRIFTINARAGTSFRMGQPAQGPPAEQSIQPFLAHPDSAVVLGSADMSRALQDAFLGGPPNRIDTAERF